MLTLDLQWFNISAPMWRLPRGSHLRFWNAFNRHSTGGHWWGLGLLQLGRRHLFYVGNTSATNEDPGEVDICVLWCWVRGQGR